MNLLELIKAEEAKQAQATRFVVYGPESAGKTSLAAHFPEPLIVSVGGETGYRPLQSRGLVPDAPHVHVTRWKDLLEVIRQAPGHCKTLCIDTVNEVAQLASEECCRACYQGDWSKFSAYKQGAARVESDYWPTLRAALDATGVTVVLIGHAKASKFGNPMGEDFDRYVMDLHSGLWESTKRWADCVLFCQFRDFVSEDGKGKGGQARVMYTTRTAAFDAKNRMGLPDEIQMGKSGKEAFSNLRAALAASKKGE